MYDIDDIFNVPICAFGSHIDLQVLRWLEAVVSKFESLKILETFPYFRDPMSKNTHAATDSKTPS